MIAVGTSEDSCPWVKLAHLPNAHARCSPFAIPEPVLRLLLCLAAVTLSTGSPVFLHINSRGRKMEGSGHVREGAEFVTYILQLET